MFVVSGDLDGDTIKDIVVGTYYYDDTGAHNYIKWYQNDNDGNFTKQTSVALLQHSMVCEGVRPG